MNDSRYSNNNALKNNPKKARSGWDVYLDALLDRNIAQPLRPWYVRHLKSFQAFLRGRNKRLDEVSGAELELFLKERSRDRSLKDLYLT